MHGSRTIVWLILLIAVIGLFRLIFIGSIPLSPDEAYYWSWSLKPAIAYFDQPGMVAWINWISNHLPSAPSAFSIRLPAVIIMAVATVFAWAGYRELFQEEKEALLFAASFNFVPIFFMSGIAMIHDTALILFLSGFYLFCFRLLKRPGVFNWAMTGIFLLGSVYSKLNAGIVGVSLALYLLVSPWGRKQLKTPLPWAAGALSVAGFLPVIVWNRNRNWPELLATSQLVKHGIGLPERLWSCLSYAGSQFAVYSPLTMLGIIAAIVAGLSLYRSKREERVLLMLCLSLPGLAYFLLMSLRSPVFANWSLIGYFPVILLFTRLSFSGFGKGKILNRSFWAAALVLSTIICLGMAVEVRFRLSRSPAWKIKDRFKLEQPLDWRLDQELEGWGELKAFLQQHRGPGEPLSARRYQIASMMEFLLPDRPLPLVINAGLKQSQFNLWNDPAQFKRGSSIFVDTSPMPGKIKSEFSRVEELAVPLLVYRESHPVKKFYIYRAYIYQASAAP